MNRSWYTVCTFDSIELGYSFLYIRRILSDLMFISFYFYFFIAHHTCTCYVVSTRAIQCRVYNIFVINLRWDENVTMHVILPF